MDDGTIPLTAAQVAEPPEMDAQERREDFRFHAARASKRLIWACIAAFVSLPLALWIGFLGGLGFAASAVLASLGVFEGVRALRHVRRGHTTAGSIALVAVFPVAVGMFMTFVGGLFALIATFGFKRGRQLRKLGRILLPRVGPGRGWAGLDCDATAPAEIRRGLAEQWRENGRTEHASVAAFARLTLDLIALGAPSSLVASAQRDALDEIRHAELCFSLARALDGEDRSPAPFPEVRHARTVVGLRTMALAQLAVDSLVDGALHEGLSAAVIAQLAKRCEVPAIRSILKELASDEGRHAAHGWDVVEWCLAQGGAPVLRALEGAILAVPDTLDSGRSAPIANGSWERWGIHGDALEIEAYRKMRDELCHRIDRLSRPALRAA